MKTLQKFSSNDSAFTIITGILDEIEDNFRAYEKEIGEEELTKYLERVAKLKKRLRSGGVF